VHIGLRHDFDGGEEAVTPPWQRLDEPRRLGRIPKSGPEPLHCRVQVVFEVNERVGGPELAPEYFPRDDVAGALKESLENL
jgi:hypothetical protein